jgi:hypothetical protein
VNEAAKDWTEGAYDDELKSQVANAVGEFFRSNRKSGFREARTLAFNSAVLMALTPRLSWKEQAPRNIDAALLVFSRVLPGVYTSRIEVGDRFVIVSKLFS